MKINESDYLHLIPACTKTHFSRCADFEDLQQTAFFGLRRGIEKYNPERTKPDQIERYLYQSIRWHIGWYLQQQTKSIRQNYAIQEKGNGYVRQYQHVNIDYCNLLSPSEEPQVF